MTEKKDHYVPSDQNKKHLNGQKIGVNLEKNVRLMIIALMINNQRKFDNHFQIDYVKNGRW